jgi:hypothetical protein
MTTPTPLRFKFNPGWLPPLEELPEKLRPLFAEYPTLAEKAGAVSDELQAAADPRVIGDAESLDREAAAAAIRAGKAMPKSGSHVEKARARLDAATAAHDAHVAAVASLEEDIMRGLSEHLGSEDRPEVERVLDAATGVRDALANLAKAADEFEAAHAAVAALRALAGAREHYRYIPLDDAQAERVLPVVDLAASLSGNIASALALVGVKS